MSEPGDPLRRLPERGGVRLRVPYDEDAERWLETALDPLQIAMGLPAFVDPPAGRDAVLARVDEARVAHTEGRPGSLVVADAGDDRFLGAVSWRLDVPPPFRIADLGYLVHPAERGRGVATTGVLLLREWLCSERDQGGLGVARVQLDHSTENPASCRVAERAGLAREGVRRSYLPLRDDAEGGVRRHDVCLHGWVAGGD